MSANEQRAATPMGGDELFAVGVIAMGVVTFAVWSGAQLAALVSSGELLPASPAVGLGAAVRLPAHGADPALAWPADVRAWLPGPLVYWVATALVMSVEVAAAVWVWLRVGALRVGTRSRERLGVAVGARLARPRDLATLVVRGPEPGRFVFGRIGKRLVATESPAAQPDTDDDDGRSRKKPAHSGRRGALAVIGPSQSGKTSTVVAGILDWDGPAVLSSVKDDLFRETVKRRLQLGQVYVFDPMWTITELPDGVARVGWSPLHAARTVPGAIEVSMALLDASPTEGVTNANYWSNKGQALLWPILFAAAHDNTRTMADVVRWLASQDGNEASDAKQGKEQVDTESRSEIRQVLDHLAHGTDTPVAIQARLALSHFLGFFKLDQRTRSDIYSTSQTLVQPWEDPYISFASAAEAGPVADLGLVLSGANTLYLSTSLKDASRYPVVFGGLLGSLLRDQVYDVARRCSGVLPDPLLAVLDEAGNTPVKWLPQVASTCSGIGVQLVTVWQSKAQIDATYQAQAGPILTNHTSKLVFAGVSDTETLDYVSRLAGEEEVPQRSANADAHLGGYRRGVGDSTIHRPLLPPEVLRQAKPGNAVLLHGSLPPAHIEGRWLGNDKRLRTLSRGKAPGVDDADRKALPEKLKAALAHDPTPPEAVLKHLDPGFPPTREPAEAKPAASVEGSEGKAPAESDDPDHAQPPEPDHGEGMGIER